MTAQDVIDAARRKLLDTVTAYRWADADLLPHVNTAYAELLARRPGLRKPATPGTTAARTAISATSTALTGVGTEWRDALAHYVAYCALSEGNDPADAKAATDHLALFERRLAA